LKYRRRCQENKSRDTHFLSLSLTLSLSLWFLVFFYWLIIFLKLIPIDFWYAPVDRFDPHTTHFSDWPFFLFSKWHLISFDDWTTFADRLTHKWFSNLRRCFFFLFLFK
jgi:hypothetical protein